MAGAKLKLTPEVQKRITDVIAAGNYNVVAAQYAGIGESTFYHWLEQGEKAKSGVYREFLEAVKNASARSEVRNVAIIETAAPVSWQAAAWLLERKHFDRWGRKERQEITGADGGPVGISWAQLAKEADEADDYILGTIGQGS